MIKGNLTGQMADGKISCSYKRRRRLFFSVHNNSMYLFYVPLVIIGNKKTGKRAIEIRRVKSCEGILAGNLNSHSDSVDGAGNNRETFGNFSPKLYLHLTLLESSQCWGWNQSWPLERLRPTSVL
jgi:hypothetical protein